MTKVKFGTCPYCDFVGELVWLDEEYICSECKELLELEDVWEDALFLKTKGEVWKSQT